MNDKYAIKLAVIGATVALVGILSSAYVRGRNEVRNWNNVAKEIRQDKLKGYDVSERAIDLARELNSAENDNPWFVRIAEIKNAKSNLVRALSIKPTNSFRADIPPVFESGKFRY